MPDRIFVTFTPTTAPGSYHAAIHYERTDADGKVVQHHVIEAKPERYGRLSPLDNVFGVIEENLRQGDGASRFGRIRAEVRKTNQGDDPSAPYEIIAEGADLGSSFAKMQLFASGFNTAGFAYRGDHQNSNTFASAALKAGELPPATGVAHDPVAPPGELLEFFAPGLNEPLRAPIGQKSSFAPADGIQHSSQPHPDGPARQDQLSGHDSAAPNAPFSWHGPAAPNTPPPTLLPGILNQPPTGRPHSNVGSPLDLTPHGLLNSAMSDGGYAPRRSPDPTGSLYFSPQPSPRQLGPFTWPGAGNGNAADQPGNDFGGVWTTAQQYMSGQAGRTTPAIPLTYNVPRTFPANGTQPIDHIDRADLTGTFASSASNNLNKVNTSQSGFLDGMDGRPPASQRMAPQPAPPVQNLTTHVLRMKGVPETDIGAAINDPGRMQKLLNQLYGRSSTIAPDDDNGGFGNEGGRDASNYQPGQTSTAATPDTYLPFGWARLPALLR